MSGANTCWLVSTGACSSLMVGVLSVFCCLRHGARLHRRHGCVGDHRVLPGEEAGSQLCCGNCRDDSPGR